MSRIESFLKWIKENWNTLIVLMVLIAGWFHLRLEFRHGAPGSDPQIVIVIPDAAPAIIRGKTVSEGQRIVDLVKTLAVDPDALERAEEAAAKK